MISLCNSSIQHCEKHNTSAPQVNTEGVTLILEDFRCYVCRSSTLLCHLLLTFLALFGDAKVSNFDITFTIKQDVIKFDIAMCDKL